MPISYPNFCTDSISWKYIRYQALTSSHCLPVRLLIQSICYLLFVTMQTSYLKQASPAIRTPVGKNCSGDNLGFLSFNHIILILFEKWFGCLKLKTLSMISTNNNPHALTSNSKAIGTIVTGNNKLCFWSS